ELNLALQNLSTTTEKSLAIAGLTPHRRKYLLTWMPS
ncbi:hypothetical protein AIC88_001932, partial [Salmonella enterica subsp. houtenae]|nr:hypothetical protein [Salmonella enterica subsp. houtenae]